MPVMTGLVKGPQIYPPPHRTFSPRRHPAVAAASAGAAKGAGAGVDAGLVLRASRRRRGAVRALRPWGLRLVGGLPARPLSHFVLRRLRRTDRDPF